MPRSSRQLVVRTESPISAVLISKSIAEILGLAVDRTQRNARHWAPSLEIKNFDVRGSAMDGCLVGGHSCLAAFDWGII